MKISSISNTIFIYFSFLGEFEDSILHDKTEYTFKLVKPYEKYEFYTKIYTFAGASDQSVHVTCQGQGGTYLISEYIHTCFRE